MRHTSKGGDRVRLIRDRAFYGAGWILGFVVAGVGLLADSIWTRFRRTSGRG